MGLEAKTQTKEIEGRTFRAWPVAWSDGLPALVRLTGILSPLLAAMFGTPGKEAKLGSLFEVLPRSLGLDDIKYFARVFGNASSVKTGDHWLPLVEENHSQAFESEYLSFLRWLTFCMEVNFGGFFGGVMKGGVGVDLAKMAKSTST